MTIREDIARIEGLAEKLKNEIEVWFERHFATLAHNPKLEQAKADLHEMLGTEATAPDAAASASAA